MKRLSPVALLGALFFLPLFLPLAFSSSLSIEDQQHQKQKEFSERDLRGPYGFSFDGFVTMDLPGGPLVLPVSAVGAPPPRCSSSEPEFAIR